MAHSNSGSKIGRGLSNLAKMPGRTNALESEMKAIRKELKALRKENKQLKQMVESNLLALQSLGFAAAKREDEAIQDTRRRVMRDLPPAALPVRMFQLAGLILLNELDDTCREHGIEYWLDFGALLGSIRHGRCIPWDDDIDVCMTRRELAKFKAAMAGNDDFFVSELYSHTPTNAMNHICQLKFKPSKVQPDLPCCLDIFIYDYVEHADDMRSVALRIRELRQVHRDEAWGLYRKLVAGGADEFSDDVQLALKDLFDRRLREAREELALTSDSGEGIVWAMDNYRLGKLTKFTHCRTQEIFPLSETMLEGRAYYAPRCTEARLQQFYGDYYEFPSNGVAHRHFSTSSEVMYDVARTIDRFAERYLLQVDERDIALARSWL